MKKVMLYHVEKEDLSYLEEIFKELSISYIEIDDSCLDLLIKDLFMEEESRHGVAQAFENAYMMMQDISHDEILDIGKRIKESGHEFHGIKIMRTATNENWTLKQLLQETAKEHSLVQKIMLLESALKSCHTLDFSKMKAEESNDLKTAMMDAYIYLKEGNFEEETLTEKTNTLMEALRHIHRELS